MHDHYVLVVSQAKADATTTLFFENARRILEGRLRIAELGEAGLPALLSSAAAVIFVRGLFEFRGLPALAQALGIPTYYFIDDNFIVVREQGGANARFVRGYSEDRVRTALRNFAGVLVASSPLMEDFSARRLHSTLVLYPPVMDRALPAGRRQPGIRIAFFGGEHLREPFSRLVLPAIRRLAREHPVTLVAVGLQDDIAPSEGLNIVQQPYDRSYARGIETLHRDGVDVFVHLVDASLANSVYKNPHALISACVLEAVPAVSDRAPYDSYCSARDTMCSADSEASWFASLSALVKDVGLRATLRNRLREYCAVTFSGAANRGVLDSMLAKHRRPSVGVALVRHILISGFLLVHLAERAWRRLTGRAGMRPAEAA